MKTVSNDDLIRAVFTATDEAKTTALAILEGREILDTDSGPLLLTMGQATKLLGVSRATLWRAIRAGSIEKVEIYSGAYRLRKADILALVNGRVGSPLSAVALAKAERRPSSPRSTRHAPCGAAPQGGAQC